MAHAPDASIRAAIDAGSNSIHLLVATVAGHRVSPIVDESAFLGLGRAAEAGVWGEELRRGLLIALRRYVDLATHLQAASTVIVGTQPFRRAEDAPLATATIEKELGVPCHILHHEEEALLTLLGVTGGRRVPEATLVVDIGGGSSELALVHPFGRAEAFGVPVGSASLGAAIGLDDPPTADQVVALRAAALDAFDEAPGTRVKRLLASGGTATNVVRLLPESSVDRRVDAARLARAMDVATRARAAVVADEHALRPARAHLLPAGIAIMEAILARYGPDEISVSDEGIREGLVLATARAGDAWRDRLEALAHGWRAGTSAEVA
jgi:exopolyphosphatase/guanosine-5'-triphosphate,3'-diphosphate pyrophosphatase